MGVIHRDFEEGDYAMQMIYDRAIMCGCNYLINNPKVKTLVLGFSGGIDSLITGILARKVVDLMNKREGGSFDYRLIGYSLPIYTNKVSEVFRAKDAGSIIATDFAEVDLGKAYLSLIAPIDNSLFYEMHGHSPSKPHDSKIRAGNIKARLRMMYLYDKAAKYDGMVLSTDNYTEYLLGFWTLHGDVGDFGFIQELWKTEVYSLADWMISHDIYANACEEGVAAIPTDGLGISNSDLDQLLPGWTEGSRSGYKKVDEILLAWQKWECEDIDNPVIERMLNTQFKRDNPVNLDRWQLIGLMD
jgi:NAD+ synthase